MPPPIELERSAKRRKPMKPATVRALFWAVIAFCLLVFAAGFYSKFA